MKIIFLNAWHGQIPKIKDFILENIFTTDIFCFQESYNSDSKIFCIDWLKDYNYFFDDKWIDQKNQFVNSTFVKRNISVLDIKTIGKSEIGIGIGLFTKIKIKSKIINLCNVHGFPWPGDKQDNPDRIKQSQLIIDFFKNLSGFKIIGGDFNLDFDIKSTKIFEENDYRSLIKDFKVDNTRNRLSWEKYNNKQYFADHLFINPDVKIINFSVPYNEVSDHLPMILEIRT